MNKEKTNHNPVKIYKKKDKDILLTYPSTYKYEIDKAKEQGKAEARKEFLEWLINLLVKVSEIGMSNYKCDELCKYKYLIMEEVNKKIKELEKTK